MGCEQTVPPCYRRPCLISRSLGARSQCTSIQSSTTMATLYGNPKAMEGVQMRGASPLVSRSMQLHGAGARNNGHSATTRTGSVDASRSARIRGVRAGGAGQTISYRRFAGKEFVEDHSAANVAPNERPSCSVHSGTPAVALELFCERLREQPGSYKEIIMTLSRDSELSTYPATTL